MWPQSHTSARSASHNPQRGHLSLFTIPSYSRRTNLEKRNGAGGLTPSRLRRGQASHGTRLLGQCRPYSRTLLRRWHLPVSTSRPEQPQRVVRPRWLSPRVTVALRNSLTSHGNQSRHLPGQEV
jgi:hypothetical protein